MPPVNKVPGKPAAPEDREMNLYKLKYMTANLMDSKLVSFSERGLGLDELIKHAKQYCVKHNIRFVFLEPAISNIQVEEIIE